MRITLHFSTSDRSYSHLSNTRVSTLFLMWHVHQCYRLWQLIYFLLQQVSPTLLIVSLLTNAERYHYSLRPKAQVLNLRKYESCTVFNMPYFRPKYFLISLYTENIIFSSKHFCRNSTPIYFNQIWTRESPQSTVRFYRFTTKQPLKQWRNSMHLSFLLNIV